jgi:hypothetical protein
LPPDDREIDPQIGAALARGRRDAAGQKNDEEPAVASSGPASLIDREPLD